jgi:GNAT superfamily N-acetyltransferase
MTRPSLPPEVLAIAETLNLCLPPPPGQQRFITPRYAAFVGVQPERHHNLVQRVRVTHGEVEGLVAELRALFRAHERNDVTWEIGPSTTPPELAERLLALGMVPDSEPEIAGMVLAGPPAETAPDVAVETVTDFAGFRAHARILRSCFAPEAPALTEDEIVKDFERRRGHEEHLRRYLAVIDGRPIAAGDAILADGAVVLCGGATLPEARGKGAYRALVEARWRDAVARGTPVLVVQAGAMSRPVLERLGFEEVARIRVLRDQLA